VFSLDDLTPALIVFDKDGTLIDFNFMWASWVMELAARLEAATQSALAPQLYRAMGYDASRHTVIAGSPLAAHSMAELYVLTGRVVHARGVAAETTAQILNDAWFVPDPIRMARPLADLPKLFAALRARGILAAIATSDDRASTLATLRALGILEMVNAVASADDGLPNKPAPDMLLRVCAELNVLPRQSAMIGDSVADMRAARAAAFGFRIGVLSGVSSEQDLRNDAEVIVASVGALMTK